MESNPLDRFRKSLRHGAVDAFLVSDLDSIQWLTGFTGSFARLVVTPDTGVFITDSRYTLQAREEVPLLPCASFRSPTDGLDFLREQVAALGIGRLHFDESAVTVATHRKLREKLVGVELVPGSDPCRTLRMAKSRAEVERIRAACAMADRCMSFLLDRLGPGRTERDILREIFDFMISNGADVAFPPIVVSGPRSARPHGTASERELARGDFVTLDLGARLDGYCSDITRTVVIGRASGRQREIYTHLQEAQRACVDALRPGANGRDIDALARRRLREHGLAEYFGHGLGHGLGRLVHDSGRLSATVDQPIAASQVWTIEPGVYIEGLGGARIEDDVLVTETGPEVLTSFPRDLTEI